MNTLNEEEQGEITEETTTGNDNEASLPVLQQEKITKPINTLNINSLPIPQKPQNVLTAKFDGYSEVAKAAQALDNMQKLAAVIVKGKMCPLKTEEDVIIAIMTGNQMGLPYMTSINYIYPIDKKDGGKATPPISGHIQRGLLLSHGIWFNKVRDYEPIYAFVNSDKKPVGKGTIDKKPEGAKVAGEVDRVTVYEFKRKIKTVTGEWEEIKETTTYKASHAEQANLRGKKNWIENEPLMLDVRAFTIGAKRIASDILFGIPAIHEIAEIEDIEYEITDNYEETIVSN